MTSNLDALAIRARLGRKEFAPPAPFGPDGWIFDSLDKQTRIIVTVHPARADGGREWVHASVSHPDRIPTYDELTRLHRAVWGQTGHAYQQFVPVAEHVNLHPFALHLWGRLDGKPALPDLLDGIRGTI